MIQMISEIKTVSGWPGLRYCSRVDRERALEKYLGKWENSTVWQACGSPACIHFFQNSFDLYLSSEPRFYTNYVSKMEIYKYYLSFFFFLLYEHCLLHNHLSTSFYRTEKTRWWWFWPPQLSLPRTTISTCH